MMDSPNVVLRLRDVVKTFPGVVALKNVSLDVRAGEVHALVGENGAGKSTLMAVAAGSTVPDLGTVEIGGQLLADPSPPAAQALGLAIVYQHLSILEDLTVLENMVFAAPESKRPPMSKADAWTREQLASVGADIDPAARVSDLTTADCELVEIAKALAADAKVLILDEPTESLMRAESDLLMAKVREIADSGIAVVYISHRLPEVKRVADRITVLRDGETRGTFDAGAISEGEILRLIIGRSVDQVFPDKLTAEPSTEALLEVEDLSGVGFHDVSLRIRPGEIVGLAGVEGNGQRSFLRALAGMSPANGSMRVAGSPVRLGRPSRIRGAGVIHLPGDRHREGVMLDLSVRENILLLSLREASVGGFVSRTRERSLMTSQIERLGVKTPSEETSLAALSGGNQQKVLFARALLGRPRVLLADEPTRGVDAGARIDLYQVMREAAADGRAVLVLSSDAVELQGLCDRVLVFSRGRIVRELTGAEITEESITGAALTSDSERQGGENTPRARKLQNARRFLAGDYLPSVVLALLIVVVALATQIDNSRFLSGYNLQTTLLLASALVFVSLGELTIILTGNFDLSVGPLMGLMTVVTSFFWTTTQGTGDLILGIGAVIAAGIAAGVVNALLVRVGRLHSVLATIATYIVIEGIALQLRPQEAGLLRTSVTGAINTHIGWMPVAMIVAIVLTVVAEVALRRSRFGLQLRAVGSDQTRAHRLGARINVTYFAAFIICSLFAALAGLILAGQIGIGDGDPTLSSNYTLEAIAAVVLGGASIFGGRGSYIGALLGAILLSEVVAAVPFLQVSLAWNQWTPGILILVGAGIFSRARGGRTAAVIGSGETG
jgi:ribose transport system ATP-binding protein